MGSALTNWCGRLGFPGRRSCGGLPILEKSFLPLPSGNDCEADALPWWKTVDYRAACWSTFLGNAGQQKTAWLPASVFLHQELDREQAQNSGHAKDG